MKRIPNIVETLTAHRDALRAELARVEGAIAVLSETRAGTAGGSPGSKKRQLAQGVARDALQPKPRRTTSEETRQKMREAQRRRWEQRKVAPGEEPADRE